MSRSERPAIRRAETDADPDRGERGFTVVEMVVTMLVMSIVTAAFLAVFSRALTDTGTVELRRDYLNDMRFAMETMTKQVRQATLLDTQLPDYLGMDTFVNGNEHHIHYQVVGTDLQKQVDGGSWFTILSDLTSSSVFTYTTVDGTVQQVQISLTVDGGSRDVQLVSQVEMRNL
jgi:prepilin-type N-terminal cleavage/methylation domain-containing protein